MKKMIFILPIIFLYGCQMPKVLSIRDYPAPEKTTVFSQFTEISEGQFFPDKLEVPAGTWITISNIDSAVWTVASDPHSSHDQIPGLFKILPKGEKITLKLANPGNYGVHLEENPSITAKFVVR